MTNIGPTDVRPVDLRWLRRGLFGALCVAVIGFFVWSAGPGLLESGPNDAYYNLLVQGFQAGRLSVNREPDPHLAQLQNPYDPAANGPFVRNGNYLAFDMSYFNGKLYLYFGVTPALVLFWPYAALTGHYLSQTVAVVLFCSLGFLMAALLVYEAWRRYFPQAGAWIAAAGIVAVGLATGLLETLASCDVYEVAASCAFAFTMLALAALWRAFHAPQRAVPWLLLSSLAYGLALGARPSLLFGAVMLFVPVIQAWRETTEPHSRQRPLLLAAAAAGPLLVLGAALMLYNQMRFGNPLEFGWHYALTDFQDHGAHQFGLSFLWFNFRFYFLEPLRWIRRFPFVDTIGMGAVPPGYGGLGVDRYGGIFIDYPIVWLAAGSLLAWQARTPKEFSTLRGFLAAVFLQFGACALLLCFFITASSRYEVDFLPALMLLAIVGIFLVDRALAGKAAWRRVARVGWILLMAYAVAFNVAASLGARVAADCFAGNHRLILGRGAEAIAFYQEALKLNAASGEAHDGLGNALVQMGQPGNAIAQYQKAIDFNPDLIEAHYDLGYCLLSLGRIQDAAAQNQIVLKLDPDFAKAHNILGSCYLQEGRIADAIAEFAKAVELAPDFPDGHNNLGFGLLQTGRVPEAIVQFQKAVDLDPQSVNFRCGLGNALLKAGKGTEAVTEYRKAVELDPALAGAHYELGLGLLQIGQVNEAIVQYQKAVEIKPDSAAYRLGLAHALAEEGLTNQAAVEYRKATELNPSIAK
ncbi:MAG TPA: tetratricopeptide repeat protein [Candidatus Sulfotelmatobacter sp.]|nr:tetratricopeptide repeat protein [Candidatus Sulfotelmatobacter sp.]